MVGWYVRESPGGEGPVTPGRMLVRASVSLQTAGGASAATSATTETVWDYYGQTEWHFPSPLSRVCTAKLEY